MTESISKSAVLGVRTARRSNRKTPEATEEMMSAWAALAPNNTMTEKYSRKMDYLFDATIFLLSYWHGVYHRYRQFCQYIRLLFTDNTVTNIRP